MTKEEIIKGLIIEKYEMHEKEGHLHGQRVVPFTEVPVLKQVMLIFSREDGLHPVRWLVTAILLDHDTRATFAVMESDFQVAEIAEYESRVLGAIATLEDFFG